MPRATRHTTPCHATTHSTAHATEPLTPGAPSTHHTRHAPQHTCALYTTLHTIHAPPYTTQHTTRALHAARAPPHRLRGLRACAPPQRRAPANRAVTTATTCAPLPPHLPTSSAPQVPLWADGIYGMSKAVINDLLPVIYLITARCETPSQAHPPSFVVLPGRALRRAKPTLNRARGASVRTGTKHWAVLLTAHCCTVLYCAVLCCAVLYGR